MIAWNSVSQANDMSYMASLKQCNDIWNDLQIEISWHLHISTLFYFLTQGFCLHWIRHIMHLNLLRQTGAHLSMARWNKYTCWNMKNTVCEFEEIQFCALVISRGVKGYNQCEKGKIVACEAYEWIRLILKRGRGRRRPISVDLVKRAENEISRHSMLSSLRQTISKCIANQMANAQLLLHGTQVKSKEWNSMNKNQDIPTYNFSF